PLGALLSVQAEPPDLRIPRVDSSDLGVYAYLKRLIPSVPSHWPSQLCEMLGLDEIYGSRYGTLPHLCRVASVSQSLPRAAGTQMTHALV
ncbi:unnamed protein product, partial [Brassica napus]